MGSASWFLVGVTGMWGWCTICWLIPVPAPTLAASMRLIPCSQPHARGGRGPANALALRSMSGSARAEFLSDIAELAPQRLGSAKLTLCARDGAAEPPRMGSRRVSVSCPVAVASRGSRFSCACPCSPTPASWRVVSGRFCYGVWGRERIWSDPVRSRGTTAGVGADPARLLPLPTARRLRC